MPFYGDPYTAVSAISDAGGIVLSRSSGYLPAFVQVSASAITATGTTRPFETLEYTWDFGDPSGTESLVNPADNGATVNPNTSQVGPEAAYVYRTAGTYTITLTIRGYTGSGYVTETCTATFTASAFPTTSGEDWYYDSVSGNNANNGLTSGTAKVDMGHQTSRGYGNWPADDAYTHYHFARGGTYDFSIGSRGIMRISAYGTGAKPILRLTTGQGYYMNAGNPGQEFHDVVISDVALHASGATAVYIGGGGGSGGSVNDVYLDNLVIMRDTSVDPSDHDYTAIFPSNNLNKFGTWKTVIDTEEHYIGAEYLGSQTGSWRFFVGTEMNNGAGYTAGQGRQTGHNIYFGSEPHYCIRYCSFGSGAVGRYFNLNIDTNIYDPEVLVPYRYVGDSELTGTWAAIDISNTVNDRAEAAILDQVVVERCLFHDFDDTWAGGGTIYSYSADNVTFRGNTMVDLRDNDTIFYIEDDASLIRVYDNDMPVEINPSNTEFPATGWYFNNVDSDNPATFGGDTSGTCDQNADYVTGILTASDAVDGMTTPNFTVMVAASHGEASINPTTGAWSYTPDTDYVGSDSFTVRVTDNLGNNDAQDITITVNSVGGGATYYAFSAGGFTYVFQTGGA